MDMSILINNPDDLPEKITKWDALFRKPINNSYRKNLKAPKKLIGSGKVSKTSKAAVSSIMSPVKAAETPLITLTPTQNTTIEFKDIK